MMMGATSCNDWLNVKPNNEQITDDFWQSKEDVEAVVMSGYYYMCQAVPTIIKWGELRGGTFNWKGTGAEYKLETFNMLPSNSLCNYAALYKVINAANSVLKYAPGVCNGDDTYYESMMDSHRCEAYFMRAYCNFILLKNYHEVPLVLEPYVNDAASFDIAKSSEREIIQSIKDDINAALATGAAKGTYEVDWQTKGRATKWALYALMADVCLWNEDYDECKTYCDMILNATDTFRPVFMQNTSQWYDMFCEGNSNESIFELNWNYNTNQKNNNFSTLWTQDLNSSFQFSKLATSRMQNEISEALSNGASIEGRVGRMLMASCNPAGNNAGYNGAATTYYLWKYNGTYIEDYTVPRVHNDANFILYRVAEVILMKATAETMTGNIREAFKLVNRIRVRAGLRNYNEIEDDDAAAISTIDEESMLKEILLQKQMEFLGEGKRWYDLLWFGRVGGGKYKNEFINEVIEGSGFNASWIQSVLVDPNAWYMPLPQADIEHNRLLVQNPYYSSK